MASLKVTLEGFDELKKQLEQLGKDEILTSLHKANTQAADLVTATAQGAAPVASGKLQQSIHPLFSAKGQKGVLAGVGTDVFYARFIEYGTVRMYAQPFLRPALDNCAARIVELYKEALREAVSRID